MKEVIVKGIMQNISKNYNYDEIKLKEIRYGIETIYLTITKLIILIIISLLIGTFKELLFFILFYSIIRSVGFGLHAKKAWHCWVLSLTLFTLIPFLIKVLIIKRIVINIIFLICSILFILYAPADTEKRPLIHKNKRTAFKIGTLIITLIYFILTFYINNEMCNSIIFAIIMQSIMILPISYKLLGLKYDNYKSYKKGGIK